MIYVEKDKKTVALKIKINKKHKDKTALQIGQAK